MNDLFFYTYINNCLPVSMSILSKAMIQFAVWDQSSSNQCAELVELKAGFDQGHYKAIMQAKIVEEMSSNLGHGYFFLSGTKACYQTLSFMTFVTILTEIHHQPWQRNIDNSFSYNMYVAISFFNASFSL